MLWAVHGSAQVHITADRTLGTEVSRSDFAYTISGGTEKQANGTINLFHSFDRFSVPAASLGGIASFAGNPLTTNVISRVTGQLSGREVSRIDGVIDTKTSMPGASFFLINPAGIVFGPEARLDVGGAFRASTADNLKLEDGTLFSATPVEGEAVLLTAAAPRAFGFLTDNPAPITVEPGFEPLMLGDFFLGGQTMSLVGGDVHINGRKISAPGGVIQIVSVTSPGDVVFTAGDVTPSASQQLGLVNISDFAEVKSDFVFGMPGGAVQIRAGTLILDSSTISAETFDVTGAALGVDVRTTQAVEIRNGALVQTMSFFAGDAGNISIATPHLTVSTGVIESVAFGEFGRAGGVDIEVGRADILNGTIRSTSNATTTGNVNIIASGTITLDGPLSEVSTSCCALAFEPTLAGDISLSAADIVLRDGARIKSGGGSGGEQPGQRIKLAASNTVSISNLAGVSSIAFSLPTGAVEINASQLIMDGGFITTSTFGAGGAGQISVNAVAVQLTNGAQIASSSQLGNLGLGGGIAVNASGSVSISGTAPDDNVSSATFSGSRSSGLFSTAAGAGDAGQVSVSTPLLTIADGGKISVLTTGGGSAGTILANVSSLTLASGGRIDSSTTSDGAGGAVAVNASNILISGSGTGLFSTASNTGNAGQIAISAGTLTVDNGGRVSVVTEGAGSAGSIVANVADALVAGGARIDSSTTGAGAGGAINVNASGQVRIVDGGSIRSDSLGSGGTGDMTIAAGDRILMDGGSISTRAATSDGGNIVLTAPNIIRLENSQITTSVESGTGGGGNIFIDPQFVILNGSSITANAFGGPGGSVTIIANNFLSDPGSVVSASSALSTPGTVAIESPDNNVAGSIAQLPRELVDASRLLRGACSARRAGAPSSFLVAGRGGVPADPDGYLPGFITAGAAQGARAEAPVSGFALAMAGWDCWR